ncbi:ferrochelatase-2, chloroplastic-like protein [Tanacetum coccineum]
MLSRLPVAIIQSWYQREGYVKSMADLIQKELQSFGSPEEGSSPSSDASASEPEENIAQGRECGVSAETMYYVPAYNRAKLWYSIDYGMFHFCIADSKHDDMREITYHFYIKNGS